MEDDIVYIVLCIVMIIIILGECMALWGEPSVVIGCICATQ